MSERPVQWMVRCPECTGTRWRANLYEQTAACTACGHVITEEWAEDHRVPAPPAEDQRRHARARVRG